MPRPLKTFIIYAREDKSFKNALLERLNGEKFKKRIKVWHDGEIRLGDNWNEVIKRELETSDLVLILLSPDCLASSYINSTELRITFERLEKGIARVVPVIVRPCLWKDYPLLRELQAALNGKSVISYEEQNDAWDLIELQFSNTIDGRIDDGYIKTWAPWVIRTLLFLVLYVVVMFSLQIWKYL